MGQSHALAVVKTLTALSACWRILDATLPDLLLVNGPGTCLPLCITAFLVRWLRGRRVRVVFVESICRVASLSLTGRLLYPWVDAVLVQWPQLLER